MGKHTSVRLRLIGLLLIIVSVAAIWASGTSTEKLDIADFLTTAVMLGIGLLVLSEIAPYLSSFKAGDVEMTFANITSNKFVELEARVAKLEQNSPNNAGVVADPAMEARKQAPALERAKTAKDDQWKGRFGGLAERDGFRLRAEFGKQTSHIADIQMIVETTDGAALSQDAVAEFFIHETFSKDKIVAGFVNGRAELSVIAWGGFTVGVWIPVTGTELELDLSELKNAPTFVRDL